MTTAGPGCASIRSLERDLASLLVQTPYVLLLSFPGINVVSAAEFAGEMGPIQNYPSDGAITGRAGLVPVAVPERQGRSPRAAGEPRQPLAAVRDPADRARTCCSATPTSAAGRALAGPGSNRARIVVRVAKRFCRIAYQMVAGRQVFRHPSCQKRHKILEKLSIFYIEHDTPIDQLLRDMSAAIGRIPRAEYAAEAEPVRRRGSPARPDGSRPAARPRPAPAATRPAARPPNSSRRRTGPRPLSAILPELLLRLGVTMVQSNPGETDLT